MVEWMNEVCHACNSEEDATFELSAKLFDGYTKKVKLDRDLLQLHACACMWIASKFYGEPSAVFKASNYVELSMNSFTVAELAETEIKILIFFDYHLAR
jgi:hypothetical protein